MKQLTKTRVAQIREQLDAIWLELQAHVDWCDSQDTRPPWPIIDARANISDAMDALNGSRLIRAIQDDRQ